MSFENLMRKFTAEIAGAVAHEGVRQIKSGVGLPADDPKDAIDAAFDKVVWASPQFGVGLKHHRGERWAVKVQVEEGEARLTLHTKVRLGPGDVPRAGGMFAYMLRRNAALPGVRWALCDREDGDSPTLLAALPLDALGDDKLRGAVAWIVVEAAAFAAAAGE